MAVKIKAVSENSLAQRAGIGAGETLLTMNGHEVTDILDFRFYETERVLALRLRDESGVCREVQVQKSRYASLGLEFETYLMDTQRACKNKCVFCFIDQLPKGMRESLYFKDDDARLSFLFGNYITLTNLDDREVERILLMKISPVNISVHTTNPELRARMMANPRAGEALSYMKRFSDSGIHMNCQLVLCPGLNDGAELERSLSDLSALPGVQSIAVVPVGLTGHRTGLYPLKPFTQGGACAVLDTVEAFAERHREQTGRRLAFCADELYIGAGRALPDAEYYEDFPQLENGVGMVALLCDEFKGAMEVTEHPDTPRRVTLATGVSAAPFLQGMLDGAVKKWHNLRYTVCPVENNFFGRSINVAGLLTGRDLLEQLRGLELGDELLIPAVMLRQGEAVFLDDMTVQELSDALHVPVRAVENDGQSLLDAVLGVRKWQSR